MKVLKVEQGTLEWHAARRGVVTGTKLADVMGSSLDRVQLIAELIGQEATEQTKAMRVTPEMERGSAEEPFAVQAYEERTRLKVDRVGFCISDEFDWLGLSPDGFVRGHNGKYVKAIEIKSPDTHTAIFYRLTNMVGMEALGLGTWIKATESFKPSSKAPYMGIPAEYKWQVVQYFLVNEDLQSLDFITYDARFIDATQKLYVVTVSREEIQGAIDEARVELANFRADWMRWRDIILPTNF
jgi:hypothetical protein